MVILSFYLDVVSRVKRPVAKTQHRLGRTLEARRVCFLQLVGHLQRIRKGSGLGRFLPLDPYFFRVYRPGLIDAFIRARLKDGFFTGRSVGGSGGV